jgi:hypothetical protein
LFFFHLDRFLELDFGSWEIIRVVSVTQKNKEGFDLPCVWSNKSKLCGFLTSFFFFVFLVLCCWFLFLFHDLRRFLNIVRISYFLNLLYFVVLYFFFWHIYCVWPQHVLLFIFGPHINIQNTKKKLKKWKTNIHKWEEHERYLENCHRLVGENQNIQS